MEPIWRSLRGGGRVAEASNDLISPSCLELNCEVEMGQRPDHIHRMQDF